MQHLWQSVCMPSASAGPECCSAAPNRLPGLAPYCAKMECLTLLFSDALTNDLRVCTKILGRSHAYPWVVEKPALAANALKRGWGLPRAYRALKLESRYTYLHTSALTGDGRHCRASPALHCIPAGSCARDEIRPMCAPLLLSSDAATTPWLSEAPLHPELCQAPFACLAMKRLCRHDLTHSRLGKGGISAQADMPAHG